MKPSGIVRRIDDLGRIVIPKEIRRIIGAAEGTPMEIFHNKDVICLKKYFPVENLLARVESLDDAVDDICIDLGAERTADIRRHIRELKQLLQEGGERDGK